MPKRIDLTGQKFGKLRVTEYAETRNGKAYWQCVCDCGKETIVHSYYMTKGTTTSCGCMSSRHTIGVRSLKHGMNRKDKTHKLYVIWQHMLMRCYDAKQQNYERYGGRGIKVCDEWRTFTNFRDDMYASYTAHVKKYGERDTTLERVDCNDNYRKENCRWATRIEQARNKRNSRMVTMNGKTQCVSAWAEELNISAPLVYTRLHMGWDDVRALITPPRGTKQ